MIININTATNVQKSADKENSPVRTSPEESPLLLGILRRSIADVGTKMAGNHPSFPKGNFRLALT